MIDYIWLHKGRDEEKVGWSNGFLLAPKCSNKRTRVSTYNAGDWCPTFHNLRKEIKIGISHSISKNMKMVAFKKREVRVTWEEDRRPTPQSSSSIIKIPLEPSFKRRVLLSCLLLYGPYIGSIIMGPTLICTVLSFLLFGLSSIIHSSINTMPCCLAWRYSKSSHKLLTSFLS